MKTNVSIKFNSIEEYREIEKKLIELGYESDKKWNEIQIKEIELFDKYNQLYCSIGGPYPLFTILNFKGYSIYKTYNSLEEFLTIEVL